ncbi:MAG TPA: hypothetical protein VF893_05295 [Candidatus Bathyarchaeia archaeon]
MVPLRAKQTVQADNDKQPPAIALGRYSDCLLIAKRGATNELIAQFK